MLIKAYSAVGRLKQSVLLLTMLALSAVVTRAETGNVNRDEDMGKIVWETHESEGESQVILDKEYSTEWESQGGGEVSWE